MFLRRLWCLSLLALTCAAPCGAVVSVPSPDGDAPRRIPRISDAAPAITPGHVLVKLRTGASLDALSAETGFAVVDTIPQLDVATLSVPPGSEAETARALGARADLLYAETDGIARAMKLPNDSFYASEQWYLPLIGMPQAWDVSTGSSSVVIAVVDSGVNLAHPDLQGKLLAGYNAVNPGAGVNDDEGHGTHVSGLAAAASNNGIGIAGASWGAMILPVKVLDRNGEGSDSVIARGIVWAADNKAWVINLSLGGPGYNATLASAVQYARGKGCLIVAAVGNEYDSGSPVEYPAAFTGVMAVGASTDTDTRASYSNVESYLSVLAPGGDPTGDGDPDDRHWILSASLASHGGYEYMAGTSQATPLVSGLAALLWSIRPDYYHDQIRAAIEGTAVDVGPAGFDSESGHGRIDAKAAALSLAGSTPTGAALPGDVNGDGALDVADAVQILRTVVGLASVSLGAGDVAPAPGADGGAYGNGQITVEDAIRVLRRVAGLEPDPWPASGG